MEGTNPKVSFIPKGSLVREESFLERPRPRSVMGFLAFFAFIISVGSYAGLYFYRGTLEEKIVTKNAEIIKTQTKFKDAPQVLKAQVFRSRALLAKELLDTHTLVSPVLSFLSDNTLTSVLYNDFAFNQGVDGPTVELSGEAPSYASLAYQGDVLRKKTKELSDVSIHGVGLTKFGTVSFALTLNFAPDYLSYTKNHNASGLQSPTADTTNSSAVSTPALSTNPAEPWKESQSSAVPPNAISPIAGQAPIVQGEQSFLGSLWSHLKFW